jgi:hypothetical protein
MQPRIKRRSFLQGLFGAGALAALWGRVPSAQAQQHTGLVFSDDIGTLDFATLYDGNLTTGIEYQS